MSILLVLSYLKTSVVPVVSMCLSALKITNSNQILSSAFSNEVLLFSNRDRVLETEYEGH